MWENWEEADALRTKLIEQGYDDAHLVPIRYKNRYYGFYAIQMDDFIEKADMSTELKWETQLSLQNFIGTKRIKPILSNPKLTNIDPRDENLTTEDKRMIIEECKTNMLYFYSVVTGTPLEEVARKTNPYSNLCRFEISHDESGVMDGLEPKDPGNTIVGGYITNGTFHDLPVWYQRPWIMTKNRRYYPAELLSNFEVPKYLYQVEEFDPYISSHRLFIPNPKEIDIMFRAWELGMTTEEYKQKIVTIAIQNKRSTCKYILPAISNLSKITPDMIHYPEGWVHAKKPWDDENEKSKHSKKRSLNHNKSNNAFTGLGFGNPIIRNKVI